MTAALWPELHATALIGTARRPWRPIPPAAPLDQLVPAIGGTEADVLLAAGALALARRAGAPVQSRVVPVTPAPAEHQSSVPPVAAGRLRSLLTGNVDVDLVAIWLRLAADRQLVAPPDRLPALFELARGQHRIRSLVAAVAGVRGTWLAAQRPEWQFVADDQARSVAAPDERLWHEGTPAERVSYLTALRRRDPAAGRERLVEVWQSEPPAERAGLLAALAVGLSLDDEEFCEAALADRRKEVRTEAVGLLANLTRSAYQARMAARVAAAVSPARRRLTVRPPAECDSGMRRDGIEVKPPPGTGERAWWLEQLIAAAPLETWSRLASTPKRVLRIDVEEGWSGTLRRGWARAAVRSRDADWAAALIESGFGAGANVEIHDSVLAAALYELLPVEALAAATIELAGAGPDADLTQLGRLLDACPTPWPPRLANALLKYLHSVIKASHPTWVQARVQTIAQTIINGLPTEGLSAVVDLAERVRAEAERAGLGQTGGVRLMDSLVTSSSVRHTMFQEFA